ncbi:MAG: hypothetical protein NTZ74_01640 [Chloroflexi bacterium]|nr:hypothetical protein [Chloroflexota bacterium]
MINITDFLSMFAGEKYISRETLRDYFKQLNPNLSNPEFRRILYGLEKRNHIFFTGSAVYAFQDPQPPAHPPKKKFRPIASPVLANMMNEIGDSFPYVNSIMWETRILHEYMIHQPWINFLIVETEKDVRESVFNHLTKSHTGKVFVSPDRLTLEKYVSQQSEPIIVSNLISRTPKGQRSKNVTYAKIEKILVDLLTDNDKFYAYQGQELIHIFENVFQVFQINETSLKRYAERRNAVQKLRYFIQDQTKIDTRMFSKAQI